jgi:hypothetical protein
MIKHAIIRKAENKYPRFFFTRHYLCNQACSITKEKVAKNFDEITCKNCLKILKNCAVLIKEVEDEN